MVNRQFLRGLLSTQTGHNRARVRLYTDPGKRGAAKLGKHLSKSRLVLMVCLVLLSLLVSGCGREPVVIWSTQVSSPDGQLIATAHTYQWAGFGNNYVATEVELHQSSDDRVRPNLILSMTNVSAYPAGTTAVQMRWTSNKSLDIAYPDGVTLDFQAILALRVAITAHPYPEAKQTGRS